jgi:tetratricopeptide (TPR) repeat protein
LSSLRNYSPELLSRLVRLGFDLHAPTPDGNLVNTIAKDFYRPTGTKAKFACLQFLLENGLDPNIEDDDGRKPIDSFGYVHFLSLADLLIDYGAEITDFFRSSLQKDRKFREHFNNSTNELNAYVRSNRSDKELLSSATKEAELAFALDPSDGPTVKLLFLSYAEASRVQELVTKFTTLYGEAESDARKHALEIFMLDASLRLFSLKHELAFVAYDAFLTHADGGTSNERITEQHAFNYSVTGTMSQSRPNLLRLRARIEALVMRFPASARLRTQLGRSLVWDSNFDVAIAELRTATELDAEGTTTARYWLGYCYWKKSDFDAALAVGEANIDYQPNNRASWSLLGDIFMSRRDYRKALDSFSKAVAIDPEFERARLKVRELEGLLGMR